MKGVVTYVQECIMCTKYTQIFMRNEFWETQTRICFRVIACVRMCKWYLVFNTIIHHDISHPFPLCLAPVLCIFYTVPDI